MNRYIVATIVEAEPEYRCMDSRGNVAFTNHPQEAFPNFPIVEEGYKIRDPNGEVSWSPKDAFEKCTVPISTRQEAGENRFSIDGDTVGGFIAETWTETAGEKTTIVRAVLKNGFEIVESSSCVDPGNYDEIVGRNICLARIKDKVWELLGFLLQTAKSGTE